jgi:hypothetical protein
VENKAANPVATLVTGTFPHMGLRRRVFRLQQGNSARRSGQRRLKPKTGILPIAQVIRKLRTFTRTTSGWDMRVVETTPAIILTVDGSTVTLPAVSGRDTSSD